MQHPMTDLSIINLKNNVHYDLSAYAKLEMSSATNDRHKMPRRGLRTSHKQYEIYIHHLQEDAKFCLGTRDPTKFTAYCEAKWRVIAKELNLCKSGPNLSSKQWQKVNFLFEIFLFIIIFSFSIFSVL